jgi:hypothetical protein
MSTPWLTRITSSPQSEGYRELAAPVWQPQGRRKSAMLATSESSTSESPKRRRQTTVSASSIQAALSLPTFIPAEDWEKYCHSGLLFPSGRLKFCWDLGILASIIYSCIAVPFRLGLNHGAQGLWWDFEVAISIAFIVDIFLTFNTAYVTGDNQLVLDRPMIRENYLRGWFVVDLASAIPIELIDLAMDQFFAIPTEQSITDASTMSGRLHLLRALRLVRLLRLLRLLKVQRYINSLEDFMQMSLQLLQLFKLIAGMCASLHSPPRSAAPCAAPAVPANAPPPRIAPLPGPAPLPIRAGLSHPPTHPP